MKDGSMKEQGIYIHEPDWFKECLSLLNDEQKELLKEKMHEYFDSSLSMEEIKSTISDRQVLILIHLVGYDAEQQALEQYPARIRNSIPYREWRAAVFERDHYTCQNCGKVGGTLHAHHIKSFKDYPKLRTVVSNGITLCKECHLMAHRKRVDKNA